MFNELKILYDVVEQNDFKEIVKRWKERFLKFYAIISCDDGFNWERVYRTCIFLEALYGSELAKSYLLYSDDTRKVREEIAVGALLSEAIEYYVVLKKLTKDELLAELDRCLEKMFNKSLEKIKKEGNND